MKIDYNFILNKVIELSLEASKRVLEIYNGPIDVTIKSDDSPLTKADTEAHEIIVKGLSQLTPDVLIVSEEDTHQHYATSNTTLFWLVDPLDGTKEFINRNGEFTVNIALIENGNPILGVVCAPPLGICYAGIVGKGAFKLNLDSPEIKTPIQVALKEAIQNESILKVVGSRSHGDASIMESFLADYKKYEFVPAGSSLKFCQIAEGIAHLYPRFGRTMEWDTAAGQAVLMAAGGKVNLVDGTPLLYGKSEFENPHFIAEAFSMRVNR
ncbi:MAG: 3'(2'),5'-bisphosphate nucleotidase CysQ [Alphaproteobacteria bacterium]|nr:3'(2'),5'-bisphosphate nucleotidase CysQ [Alphaproteobacteria bacterium]